MLSSSSLLSLTAFVAVTNAHGVILGAQGIEGSPSSVGFQVRPDIARNCTSISPCQQDATLIRDAEINANIVNSCGRTELSGNIDVGENTENALAAGQVTKVQGGTQITMTIHQVNADGAGPYFCDLDETSNGGIFTSNLTVTNNVPGANGFSQAKTQAFNITVTMPDKFACTGASTGDVCTVRCRNTAVAGPFGGCVAVQQVDGTPKVNTPDNIATLKSLDLVLSQVAQNNKDLPAAVAANQNAGSDAAKQQQAAVASLLPQTIVSAEFAAQTPELVNNPPAAGGAAAGGAAANATTTAAAAGQTGNANAGKGNGRNGNGKATGNGRGANNANAGNANAGNNAANGAAGNADAGAATGNNNAATGKGRGNANAATGNGNAATGNGRGANAGNNAAANDNADNAAGATAKGNAQGNDNNNKRSLRWAKRMVSPIA